MPAADDTVRRLRRELADHMQDAEYERQQGNNSKAVEHERKASSLRAALKKIEKGN